MKRDETATARKKAADPEILEDLELISDDDDLPSNDSGNPRFAEIADRRMSRRGVLAGLAGSVAAAALATVPVSRRALANPANSTLTFAELPHVYDDTHHVADGYSADVLIRWGDPVLAGAPPFDPDNLTPEAQLRQFGYNSDFIGYLPLPGGPGDGERGLLCVSHEYTNRELMFAGTTRRTKLDRRQTDVEMAAHGHSIVEIEKRGGKWRATPPGRYNRRLHAGSPMRISGPAAGHPRLRTKADPTGVRVLGTISNCAGGVTPWGTVLIAEENFHGYFAGATATAPESRNYRRYGLRTRSRYSWPAHHARFDVAKEPNEANRFGWMVEIDPYDPASVPVKRTALGRFKHEGATLTINRDGRIVAYSGDDQRFEYIYRFVSTRRFDADSRGANRDLLDDGTLFAAKFNADGTLDWLPLVWGTAPLVPANGFDSQADVLIETRRAADLMGATPMDRPEDIQASPVTGIVYAMLTNNTRRGRDRVDAVNPRPKNRHGHIVEMIPPGAGRDADHAARRFRWEIPLMAGNPAKAGDRAKYHPDVSAAGWLSAPDNCAFDRKGRLWIATDGARRSRIADGLWATDCAGGGRMLTRHFFAAPRGAELCGPCFTPDDRTLFAAVQHPAAESGSTFAKPTTRWPDFDARTPPRPSVIAITKDDGGTVGG